MRPEKNTIVDELKVKVTNSPFVLITDYTGLRVPGFNTLRDRLSEVKAEYRVVKNTLLRRAIIASGLPDAEEYLKGQTAVVIGDKDVAAAAKVLKTFAKEFQKPVIKGGVVGKDLLPADSILEIAELPSIEVVRGKLLGLINTPASQLVRLLNTPASQLARVIQAKADAEGAPAAEEAPAAA
ncbi:50S ribosomal protein L10 [Verrucomicrobia bacterium LW23]|nr:50S ribosomal protein L10 [Verrucomicrobia bacterium LW23]